MQSDDEIIVTRCLEGDQAAFAFLVEKYKGAVHAYAYHRLLDYQEAQDIVQEVFIKAYRKLAQLKWPHRFQSWLYTIASNECSTWLREHLKDREQEVPLEDVPVEDLDELAVRAHSDEDIELTVKSAMETLPHDSQLALSLYYMSDLSTREVAGFMGISPNNAGVKLHRARKQLGERLGKMIGKQLKKEKLGAGFTFGFMNSIRNMPIPSLPKPPFTKWTPIPVSIGIALLIGIIGFGISSGGDVWQDMPILKPLEMPCEVSLLSELDSYPEQAEAVKMAEGNTLHFVAGGSEIPADDRQKGALQCRLSPGDILTYKVHKESLSNGRVRSSVKGTRLLLVTDVWDDEMRIIQSNLQDNFIHGGRKTTSFGGLGFLYVKRDGRADRREGSMFFNAEVQQLDGDLYFVPFPSMPLKQGATWVDDRFKSGVEKEPRPARYTVVGFEEVNGYYCVILDREQNPAVNRELKSRIACDTESGMIIKFDSELKVRKHPEKGDKTPRYYIDRLTVELNKKEQLDKKALLLEKQIFDEIESAYKIHRYIEVVELNRKLEKIKKQYPKTRLMLGLNGMINYAEDIMTTRAKNAEKKYTYSDQMYTIARLLTMQYEMNGKYMKYVSGTAMKNNKRTPSYDYEVIRIVVSNETILC